MSITELFETIQDEFVSEDLNGEFLLHGNVIIWSHNLKENNKESTFLNDDDDELFNFDGTSTEELLLEAYQEDFDKLQEFFDGIEETDNWEISDNEIIDDVIIFKIY